MEELHHCTFFFCLRGPHLLPNRSPVPGEIPTRIAVRSCSVSSHRGARPDGDSRPISLRPSRRGARTNGDNRPVSIGASYRGARKIQAAGAAATLGWLLHPLDTSFYLQTDPIALSLRGTQVSLFRRQMSQRMNRIRHDDRCDQVQAVY